MGRAKDSKHTEASFITDFDGFVLLTSRSMLHLQICRFMWWRWQQMTDRRQMDKTDCIIITPCACARGNNSSMKYSQSTVSYYSDWKHIHTCTYASMRTHTQTHHIQGFIQDFSLGGGGHDASMLWSNTGVSSGAWGHAPPPNKKNCNLWPVRLHFRPTLTNN